MLIFFAVCNSSLLSNMSVYDLKNILSDEIYEKQDPEVEEMFKLFEVFYVSCYIFYCFDQLYGAHFACARFFPFSRPFDVKKLQQ